MQQDLLCMQAAEEEEVAHLQTMLLHAKAAEAEANQRATDAEQKVATTPRQRDSRSEQALQQVCGIYCLCLTSVSSCLLCARCHAWCHWYVLMDRVHLWLTVS